MKAVSLREYLNHRITITMYSDAKYAGTLSAIYDNQNSCVLTRLIIINKNGGATSPKYKNKRKFAIEKIKNVELCYLTKEEQEVLYTYFSDDSDIVGSTEDHERVKRRSKALEVKLI